MDPATPLLSCVQYAESAGQVQKNQLWLQPFAALAASAVPAVPASSRLAFEGGEVSMMVAFDSNRVFYISNAPWTSQIIELARSSCVTGAFCADCFAT